MVKGADIQDKNTHRTCRREGNACCCLELTWKEREREKKREVSDGLLFMEANDLCA